MQKACSAFRHWAVTLVSFSTTCLVGFEPSSLLNNTIKKYYFVATPQKLAMGIFNSAAGLYCLVLIYFQSPGPKCACRSMHPSWSWRPAVCIPSADVPLMPTPFITIRRDASLPDEFLDTWLDQKRVFKGIFQDGETVALGGWGEAMRTLLIGEFSIRGSQGQQSCVAKRKEREQAEIAEQALDNNPLK